MTPAREETRGAGSSWRHRAKRAVAGALLLTSVVVAAAVLGDDGSTAHEHWTFLDPSSLAELGLMVHGSKSGAWGLEDHEAATGGRVLANHEGEPGASPALLVSVQSKSRDLRARTRCKVVGTSMSADAFADSPASCGIVFRFLDEGNHWVVRADVGEGVLEAAAIVRGEERLLGRASVARSLAVGTWMDLVVEVRGDVLRASLDGQPALVAEAPSVPAGFGATGLWVPSGTTVYFDHFTIETLAAVPRALEILPLLGRRPG